jgi:hypothetical protein
MLCVVHLDSTVCSRFRVLSFGFCLWHCPLKFSVLYQRRPAVIVRVSSQSSFCDARRFNSYLEKRIQEIFAHKGFSGEYTCEARLLKSAKIERNAQPMFSFKLVVHGSDKIDAVVSGQALRVGLAIRQGLRTLENRIARYHERNAKEMRHRIKTGKIFAAQSV